MRGAVFWVVIFWAGVAVATEPAERFDHGAHLVATAKKGLDCLACHQEGGLGKPTMPGESSRAVATRCHDCHNPADGRKRIAPRRCATCHDAMPRPADHGAGWLDLHGAQAQLGVRACRECHKASTCVECHERKEQGRYRVHDPSWLSVHGIAVRADPASCDSCHLSTDCRACHTGAAP